MANWIDTRFNTPLPPRPAAVVPKTDFDAWCAKQIKNGHDRRWISHNLGGLRARFQRDQTDLPVLPAPEKPRDRYEEL